MTTLEEQRAEEREARIDAQREAKQIDQARIEAERALAVAETRTEAAQQQAQERAQALQQNNRLGRQIRKLSMRPCLSSAMSIGSV